jgi:hypothetical protein
LNEYIKRFFEFLFRKYMKIDIISMIYIIFDDFDILIFQDVSINDFFYVQILNEFLFMIHSKNAFFCAIII